MNINLLADKFAEMKNDLDRFGVEFVVLIGSLATNNFIDGWSDIDVVLVSESISDDLRKYILVFENSFGEIFNVRIKVDLIEKIKVTEIIKHSNLSSRYLKYYKAFADEFKESIFLYRNQKCNTGEFRLSQNDIIGLDPRDLITHINNTLSDFENKPNFNPNQKESVRKIFKNYLFLCEIYYLGFKKKYVTSIEAIVNSKELSLPECFLKVHKLRFGWSNVYPEDIEGLYRVFKKELLSLSETILGKYE